MSTAPIKSNLINLLLSKTIYEKDAILAANYALSGWCVSSVEPGPDGYFNVTLQLLSDNNYRDFDIERVKQCFLNELTDQQLRLDLEKKYGPIRELIVKQAFSPLENLEKEVEKLVGRA